MTRRYVIGGVDVTDDIRRVVDRAPPFSPAQADQLRLIWAGMVPARSPRQRQAAIPVLVTEPLEAA